MTTVAAFGLAIESEISLPEARVADAVPEVTIRLGKVDKPPGDDQERAYAVYREDFRVYWRGVGTFSIRAGSEVVVEPEQGAEEAVLRLYLLGPVLGLLLHQRGFLVLHASVVAIGGAIIGFLGEKGWGKSTTAAALHAHGHGLISDDVLAVLPGINDTLPLVQPGLPHFKLWPEAVEASFGDDPRTLSRLHSGVEKRIREANADANSSPAPLRRLYVLGKGAFLESVSMSPSAAMMSLVRHSYFSSIMHALEGTRQNFEQCARIVRQVPVHHLQRPRNLHALREIVRLVEAEAEAGVQPTCS